MLDTGLVNSYVIELDTDINMCYAFNTKTHNLQYHQNNRGIFTMRLNSDGTTYVSNSQSPKMALHAWIMMYCWTVASLLEVFSNRYWKHFYKVH